MHPPIPEGGDVIGRDEEKKMVTEFLEDSNVQENASIVAIVGMGGLGKTALAQWVYHDEIISKKFHIKMWVVSTDFDEGKIVKQMIASAKKREPAELAIEPLITELRAEIHGKRYLLVLDDTRHVEQETWLKLKALLMEGAQGSKILITTRDHSVAHLTSAARTLDLNSLHEDPSLDLFMQMAGLRKEESPQSYPEMLAIARDIVKKCFGVPLAIQTIGSLLYKKSIHEWRHFLENKLLDVSEAEAEAETEAKAEARVKSTLKLSYDHLPPHLQACFSFCSLFPKNYEMQKQTLINLWIAEGFILPSSGQHLEDIANGYFMELVQRSLFHVFQKDPFINKETCRIHTLLHDLACSVAESECRVPWHESKHTFERTRHMSHGLTSKLTDELLSSCSKPSSLQTFLSAPTYHEMEQREPTREAHLRQLIESFKKLRILDLHAAIVRKMPRSIYKLKHLTYLDLSHNNELKKLPNSITRLQNLQTLNLQGCSALEELPRDIKKLVSLRNLDIDYCYSLSYVPHGLGQLSRLHRLTRFILPKGKALTKNYCGLGELNELNDLSGSLSIENLGHSRAALAELKAANLIEKHSLQSLTLKWCYLDTNDAVTGYTDEALLDGLMPHSNLQKLIIDRYEGESFPKWMMDSAVLSLPKLVEVRLLRCGRCKHLLQLSRLPHLKSLEIWRLPELELIESDHSSTSTPFSSLLRLEIHHCENLKAMPTTPNLEDLILSEVNGELINQIIDLNELKSLDISRVELLKRLPEKGLQSLTSLERLGISECPLLTSLLHGLKHLSNLSHLSLSNCEELDLCKGEMNNKLALRGLQKIQSVDIQGLPKLASLPQWLLHLSNLEHLSIKKCSNLRALPKKIGALQSLKQLEIIKCPLLTSLPKGMTSLASLDHLKVAGCQELLERCEEDKGDDWYKIKNIRHITRTLEYYERYL